MPKEVQLTQYGLKDSERLHVIADHTKIIDDIDIVLGTYSTFLYTMVELLKPVGILETNLDYGYGMVENGLADKITLRTLVADIKKLQNLGEHEVAKRRNLLIENPVPLHDTLKEFLLLK